MTQRSKVESLHFPRRAEESGTFGVIDSPGLALETFLVVVAYEIFGFHMDSHTRLGPKTRFANFNDVHISRTSQRPRNELIGVRQFESPFFKGERKRTKALVSVGLKAPKS